MSKSLKWTIIVFGVLAIGAWVGLRYLSHRAGDMLSNAVSSHLEKGIELGFEKVSLNIFKGDLGIKNLYLRRQDDSVYQWSIEVGDLYLQKFNLYRGTDSTALSFAGIGFEDVKVNILSPNPNFKIFKKQRDGSDDSAAIHFNLNVDSLTLRDGMLNFNPGNGSFAETNFSFTAAGMHYRSSEDRPVWKSAVFNADSMVYRNKSESHHMVADALELDLVQEQLQLIQFKISAREGNQSFLQNTKYRSSRVSARADTLTLNGFPPSNSDVFQFKELVLTNPSVHLLRNNRLPFPERVTELPQTLLSKLDFTFEIEQIVVDNGQLDIELLGERLEETTTLSFYRLQAQINQLQNKKLQGSAFTASASAQLRESRLQLNLNYLYGVNDPWELDFEAGRLEMSELNHLLKSQVGMTLTHGILKSMRMELKGNLHGCSGILSMEYNELDIALADDIVNEKSGFLKFLVDKVGSLVYHRDNPHKHEEPPRTALIGVERNVQKDFTGQWIDALMAGAAQVASKVDTQKLSDRGTANKSKREQRKLSKAQ